MNAKHVNKFFSSHIIIDVVVIDSKDFCVNCSLFNIKLNIIFLFLI